MTPPFEQNRRDIVSTERLEALASPFEARGSRSKRIRGTVGGDWSSELLELLVRQIAEVEERGGSFLANEAVLAKTAAILQSVPEIGLVV